MKNIFIISLMALTLFFTGCNDWIDVNHDPNALEKIPEAKVLLPSAQIGIANNLMGWNFGFGGAFWVQYWTQSYTASQFKSLCEYLPEQFNTAYTSLTREPLMDLKLIKKMTENDANKGYYFVAEALSIYTWQIITDVWGDIPYNEALKGDEGLLNPKQDQGKDIYASLMQRIDALLAMDLSNSSIDENYDYIYQGSLEQWSKFVNALKLKLMIRLSETEGYDNNATLNFVQTADLLTASAKIPGKVWDDAKEGKRHPMREFEAGGAGYLSTNVIGCKSFVDYLQTNADPRLAKLFGNGTKAAFFGDFHSKFDSDGNGTTDDKETYCTVLFEGNMDLMLMSDWEVNFYKAEVFARAGDKAKAKAAYEAGVKASLAQHGISDETMLDASGYAKWVDGTEESEIKQIAMQKWIANCNYQHIESFLERNRTKYPAVNEIDIAADRSYAYINFPVGDLTISVKGRALLNGNLPASPLYPESYIFRNINAPSQKASVGEKVWWNKKAGK